jgi:hypothetical protein
VNAGRAAERTESGTPPRDVAGALSDQNWLTVALAEYSAVRAEIVQALQAQHAIVSYGASVLALSTAVAIGTAGDASTGDDTAGGDLETFLFLVANPLLVVVIYMLWGSEVLRMQRAGTYLFAVEQALNAQVSPPRALNWEYAVNPPAQVQPDGGVTRACRVLPHVDRLQRIAVPAALVVLMAGSIVAGLLIGHLDGLAAFSVLTFAAGVLGFVWLERERRRLRTLYAQVGLVATTERPFSVEAWLTGLAK